MPGEHRFAEVRKLLESHGWTLERIRGSHHIFDKAGQSPIVIPVHQGRVKPAYVRLVQKRIAEGRQGG